MGPVGRSGISEIQDPLDECLRFPIKAEGIQEVEAGRKNEG